VDAVHPQPIALDSPETYFNRELSWLAFARRVLALVEDPELQLLDGSSSPGIMGMLHDEFFMKRVSAEAAGAARPQQALARRPAAGRRVRRVPDEILEQVRALERVLRDELRPALDAAGSRSTTCRTSPPTSASGCASSSAPGSCRS